MVKFHESLYQELKLYIRYSAWLNATPERVSATLEKSEAPQFTRLEALRHNWVLGKRGRKAEDYEPDMPPLNGSAYLVAHLYEVGPTLAGGMGPAPLTFEELEAWMNVTGVDLDSWEVRFIHELSKEYLSEYYKAGKRDREAPWTREVKPVPVVTNTQAWLRSLAKI